MNPARDGRIWRIIRLDALLGITITGIVFDTILASQVHLTGAALWATIGFHYFAPWWALPGWLFLGPRPRITWAVVAAAFIWPVLWIIYTFIRGAITDWYPYPFLDAHIHGYGTALRNTALVLVLAAVLAVAFRLLDRLPTASRTSPH